MEVNKKRLTNEDGYDAGPVWSPDGTSIAFYSDRTGNMDIYLLELDGSIFTRLTFDPAGDYVSDWWP